MAFKGITAFVLGNNGEGGGGGGGTTNYNDLTNHPQINGNELTGNKTADQLGLLPSDTDIPTKLSDLDEDTTHRTVTDLEKQSWNNKVDSVAGKGLSTNDYTDGEKEDVAQIDGLVGTVGSLSSAVGIVSSKVGTLEGEMLSVQDALDTKVDKETGKGLSANDYTNADKAIVDGVTTALASKVDTSSVGTANGVAGLDNTGRVPSSQLPSYVDDVLEYASLSAFPATGEGGKIYIALDTNKTYRWSGSAYVEISESLALGETQGTAYEGNKGKANADAIDVLETTVEAIPDQIETVVKDTVGFVGKNLFDYTLPTANYEVDVTKITDGLNIKSKSSGQWHNASWTMPNIAKNTNMTFSCNLDYVSGSFRLVVKSSSSGGTEIAVGETVTADGKYTLTFNSGEYDNLAFSLYITLSSATIGEVNVTDIQLEKGTTATSYEPYHETVQEMFDSLGTASTKNAISVVTDSSDLVESEAVKDLVGWGNKNLADVSKTKIGVAWNSIANTARARLVIPCEGDTKYTISINGTSTLELIYARSTPTIPAVNVGETFNTTITITTSSDDAYIVIGFNKTAISMSDIEALNLQLEVGSTATSYEPYHESVSDSLAQKADNSVIAPTENSATASKDYAVGDYFIKDTILGKTKAAIASGGTFTKDTNYEETNVAKELTELYKYIGILTAPVEAFTANSLPILKRNITNAFYNGSLRAEIAAGNFKNVRPGDYIIGQATGSIYYVVECDYWLGNGDNTNGTTYPAYNTHHLGLMLFKPVGTTALWRGYGYSDKSWRVSAADLGRCPWNADTTVDPTDTEAIGSNSTNITRSYNGTNMSAYMGSFIRERIDAILLPQCFQADFGSENVLKRRNWLSNAINASAASGARSDWQGIASSSVWVDRFIDLASEVELYGSRINSSSRDDIGVQNKQLPIYRNGRIHDFYPRMDLWTKGIASATLAAHRTYYGHANASYASRAIWACPLGCVK